MFALELTCAQNQRDRLIAELWEWGTAGVIERDDGVTAYFEQRVDPRALVEAFREFAPRIAEVPDSDWVASARQSWEPLPVGRRFFLVAEWRADPTPSGRLRLEMRPRQACGTGLHPATRLCLELLEDHLRPGSVVLDVGTGSGLLAAAAALLGAGRVLACDIEQQAVLEAGDRFRSEHLHVDLFLGSLRSVRSRSAHLILLNIHAEAVLVLAPELARVLVPGGGAIVSGFRRRDLHRVQAALKAVGLQTTEMREQEGWLALVCYTPSYAPP